MIASEATLSPMSSQSTQALPPTVKLSKLLVKSTLISPKKKKP
jgi:hypothetical protein